MIKKLHLLLIVLLIVVTSNGCGISVSGSIHGIVLEEGTNKPIEGAIVVARWVGEKWPIQPVIKCFHVETAVTDRKGRYVIPNTIFKVGNKIYKDISVMMSVYKPGRKTIWKDEQGLKSSIDRGADIEVIHMEGVSGTRKERMLALSGGMVRCDGAGESKIKLAPLYEDIYKRVEQLADPIKDEVFLENMRILVERIKLNDGELMKWEKRSGSG